MYTPVVAGSFTCSSSPTVVSEDTAAASGTFATSLTVTPSGGVGTKTYEWTIISELGSGVLSINSPTAATTTFNYIGLSYSGAYISDVVRCTVTDSLGNTTYVNVSVGINRTSGGGLPP